MLEPHRAQAVAAVQRAMRGTVDAEDCVQEATIRLAWRDDLDPARVRALLTRAAVHIAIDRLRSRRREERALARLGADLTSRTISPEDVVADRAEVERLLAAVDTLPRRERQVMRLRLSGLSVMETAKLLGLSHKSVEGMYTRARARVRLVLGTVLAWLAGKLRRAPSPRDEALVTAAALLFFASPLWHHGPLSAGLPTRPNARAATAGVHGVSEQRAMVASDATSSRGGTGAGGTGGKPGGGGDGRGHGHPPPTLLSTGPVTIGSPGGPDNGPPLFYFGGVSVTGHVPQKPVQDVEDCIANGFTFSLNGGGGCAG
jgi:RNA polymerase sigma-70 factor (ECF subfamily)